MATLPVRQSVCEDAAPLLKSRWQRVWQPVQTDCCGRADVCERSALFIPEKTEKVQCGLYILQRRNNPAWTEKQTLNVNLNGHN